MSERTREERDWLWEERYEQHRGGLPELTRGEYGNLVAIVGLWLRIKAEHESRWTEEQRQCLRQLDPDVWHSSLLWRMLGERKPPLAQPPPLSHAYPVYPEDDAGGQR